MIRPILFGFLAAAPLSFASFLACLALGLTRGNTVWAVIAAMVLGGGFLAGRLAASLGPKSSVRAGAGSGTLTGLTLAGWTLYQAADAGSALAGLIFFVAACGIGGAAAGQAAGYLAGRRAGA